MNKKVAFSICFLFSVICSSYAMQEAYFGWGNSFMDTINIRDEPYQAVGGHIGMTGLGVNLYEFWNRSNWGLLLNCGMNFSVYNTSVTNLDNYMNFCVNSLFGPGYRYAFGNKYTMLFGFGMSFSEQAIEGRSVNKVYKDFVLNFGLGGQLGFKLDFTDIVGMMFAFNTVYTFANYMLESAKWGIISNVALSPFIGFSINQYGERGLRKNQKFGKL
jgi:hypothetical protein